MKKLFFLSMVLLALSFVSKHINPVHAQRVTTLTPTAADDTLTNTDTATVYISAGLGSNSSAVIESEAVSIRAKITRLSGTLAGVISLEGNTSTGDWKTIASDTLSNAASATYDYGLKNSVGELQYVQYRLVFKTSGTVSAIPKGYYVRRSK
jgi:hypothetical protein